MNSTINFLLLILFYLLVIWKAGKTHPILYLFLFTYYLQYIFSTFLIYNEYSELRGYMPISQDHYFDYTLVAFAFLFAGVFLFNRDVDLQKIIDRINIAQAARLGYLLLFVSYFFDIVKLMGVPAVEPILSFTSYLKYLAAFCFVITNSKFNYLLVCLIYFGLLVSALGGGVFMDFFIYSTYLFFFISLKLHFPFWLRASFMVLAIPILVTVQSVKEEYRKATWTGKSESGLGTFWRLAEKENKKSQKDTFAQSDGVVKTVARLSEGWHLGLTLRWVPAVEPISDGKEMFSDIASSLLPRFLFPDKKTVHTHEKFLKYTGYRIRGNTSMTIGILGDFYINFGREGSFIMLFFFGASVTIFFNFFLKRFVINDPINIIWIPFLLSYLIRGDNDFYIFFNCLVKGLLIFFLISFIRRKLWGQNI